MIEGHLISLDINIPTLYNADVAIHFLGQGNNFTLRPPSRPIFSQAKIWYYPGNLKSNLFKTYKF